MTMNPLPPQAYTKETLVQAYAWLQNQSESVKEIATTPDVLVSLYLKAKLQGQDFFERPSIQNFKNELKNLAGMIGEFEVLEPDSAVLAQTSPAQTSAAAAEAPVTQQAQASYGKNSVNNNSNGNNGGQSFRFRSQDLKAQAMAAAQGLQAPAPQHSQSAQNTDRDTRTEAMIQEVKLQFNLSSEEEALRLLVSTGFHQLKTLIK